MLVYIMAIIGGLVGGLLSGAKAAVNDVDPKDRMDDRWETAVALIKISIYGGVAGALLVLAGDKLVNLDSLGLNPASNAVVATVFGVLGGIFSDQLIGKAARKLGLLEEKQEEIHKLTTELVAKQQAALQSQAAAKAAAAIRSQVAAGNQSREAMAPAVMDMATPVVDDGLADLLTQMTEVTRAKTRAELKSVRRQEPMK